MTQPAGRPTDNLSLHARRRVIVYTHSMLGGSMTFVQSHAEALSTFQAVYAGAHRVSGLELPDGRTVICNQGGLAGKARELAFRRFGIAPRFYRDLRQHQPSLVHAHFGTSGPAAMHIARSLGIPLVVTFHGKDATTHEANWKLSHRGREFVAARRRLAAFASYFIAVSDYIHGKLVEQGFPADRIVTLRNGIDTAYFTSTLDLREPIVVFVGRFVEKKGAHVLVEAMGNLRQRNVAARLVMIGDGPGRATLEQQAARLGVDALFTGFQPLSAVKDWLNRAAVVAVPSVTAADGDSEGLPTVIIEAQAMESPIVSTRHSGIPEGVIDGKTALLVEERDTAGLAGAIATLLSNPGAARGMGRAGREFVTRHFNLETQVAALEALYRRACSSQAPALKP
jgi:colanic acid/amylovoran biosynthesis glycosyltransferase